MICPHCGKETMDTTTNLFGNLNASTMFAGADVFHAGRVVNATVCNPTPNAPLILNAAAGCTPTQTFFIKL